MVRKRKVGAMGARADKIPATKTTSSERIREQRSPAKSLRQLIPAEEKPLVLPGRGRDPASKASSPAAGEKRLGRQKPAPAKAPSGAGDGQFAAILEEIRGLKEAVGRLEPPSPVVAPAVAPGTVDAPLEGAVDSLRRLLSELIEERTELLVRDLVKVRQEAATLPEETRGRIVEPLDRILESLGAARFDAEPMELVDPLIHTVAEVRWQEGAPEGVIIETVGPGYRTARRFVVWKAAVAVNRRA